MKRSSVQHPVSKLLFGQISRGVTLVEAMIALTIFTSSAAALGSAYVSMAKHTERNSYAIAALNAVQTVAEQIQLMNYVDIEDDAKLSFDIKLTAWDNVTSKTYVQTFPITWAIDANNNPDLSIFTNIGVHENEPTPIIHGVLYNVAQRNVAQTATIRERKYMPVRVNITREIESLAATQTTLKRVRILLRYQWAIPGRFDATGNPIYSPIKEFRILRSSASSY